MPFAFIPFLLLIVPIAEIAAFIVIGGKIGLAYTLLLILVTAIAGTILLRIQGLQLFGQIRSEMNNGRLPGRALVDGVMIMIAGILLLTPGFITDAIGFSLFVPFVRTAIWSLVSSRIVVDVHGVAGFSQEQNRRDDLDTDDVIIDLDENEYETSEVRNEDSPWREGHRKDR